MLQLPSLLGMLPHDRTAQMLPEAHNNINGDLPVCVHVLTII